MWLAHHPAPGFGELLPGFFVVPQNPIFDNKSRALAPMAFAGVRGPKYIPSIGEILPGRFSVPQNPLIAGIRKGLASLGGCCCNGSVNGANPSDAGTGFINGSPVMSSSSLGEIAGSINWVTVAVAVGGAYLLMKKG